MLKPIIYVRGAWVKWHVLAYLGMQKRKRWRHLAVTDEVALGYWENLYRIKRRP